MLKLQNLPADKKSYDIVNRFINNRLIKLMKDEIMEAACSAMEMQGKYLEIDPKKPLSEIVGITELMSDRYFADSIRFLYLPPDTSNERAVSEFFSLYRLLKAKKEYVPHLTMEYVLYHIIQVEIQEINAPEDERIEYFERDRSSTVKHIPEPDRTYVRDQILREIDGDRVDGEDPEEFAEYMLSMYEDLKNYDETCFWDFDFLLLNKSTEEDIANSELNKMMGITDLKPDSFVEIPLENKDGEKRTIKARLNIDPWDVEDE